MFGIIAFLLLAMPFAVAQANETVEIKGGKEYPLLQRALDRITLAFTLQIERRLELMNKIEERRLEHYNFLVAKGKTEQAEAFKERTVGLVKNFDEWRENKLNTTKRFEERSNETREIVNKTEKPENITMREKPEVNRSRSY